LKDINKIVSDFESITLQNMDSVSLMNRVDFKYTFSNHLLPQVLKKALPYYKILEIEKNRIFGYRSLYYDTVNNKMYLDHHNGRVDRYKIRFRSYIENSTFFLEIKHKIKGVRTIKTRIKTNGLETELTGESAKFIRENSDIDTEQLEPKIYVSFRRLTLVNEENKERITVDHDLSFEKGHLHIDLPKLAVVEVKRSNSNGHVSHFTRILKDMRIRPFRLSKYCIGRVLTDETIKYNQFKEKILFIDKINKQNVHS